MVHAEHLPPIPQHKLALASRCCSQQQTVCTITSHKQHAENAVPVAHTSTESTTQITPHLSPHSSDQLAIPIGSHMVQIYSALSLFTSMLTRHAIGRKTECAILHHSSQRCPRNEVHEDPVPVLLHFHSQRRSMNRLVPIFSQFTYSSTNTIPKFHGSHRSHMK